MATIKQRIEDLIGSDYAVIPANSRNDLVNAAVSEVADSLPPELLLKYCSNVTEFTASYDGPEEKKVLLVTRKVSDVTNELRECTPVPYNEFLRASDSTSMYEATIQTPVYTYDVTAADNPILKVHPAPTNDTKAKVWFYLYPIGSTAMDASTLAGLPDSCLQAIVLRSCINLLQAYISDFVQDEEDVEMQGMLTAQIEQLHKAFVMEMGRFTEQDGTPRGE